MSATGNNHVIKLENQNVYIVSSYVKRNCWIYWGLL